MILYYAVGGGLGHLTRARAVVQTLGLGEEVVLLTASPHAADRRVTGDLRVVAVPLELTADRAAYRDWLSELLARLAPAAVYLDAFPGGILGELCDLPALEETPVHHLARLLRWPEYHPQLRGLPPRLEVAYLLEPLATDHERFVRAWARRVEPLTLVDPPAGLDAAARARVDELTRGGRPLWLIVHAGMSGEVAELIAYAEAQSQLEGVTPALALVAPEAPRALPPHVTHLDVYPATPLFPLAGRIITAAGFNSMRQAEPYRARHHFLPFERRFDDQFARAARQRAALGLAER